jgi:plasmid replication initiation protein
MARIKKKSLPSSSIVTQANGLVTARYTLPLAEQRLILTMIARIQPDDEDFKPYRISVGDLAEFIGVARGSAYLECKKITENLLKRVLSIEEPDGLLQVNWVSSAKYIDGTGMVNLSFDPLLKPYLLKLQGNFTSCKLEMLLSFKSQYTMRMYNVLKQYEWRKKEQEIEIELLREMLGLHKDQHTEYSNFKKNILKPVQKELAEKADLTFEFNEIKYGRSVGAINFRIFSKTPREPASDNEPIHPPQLFPFIDAEISPSVDKLLLLVPEPNRTRKTVQAAVEAFERKQGFDYVKRNILYSNAKADKSYAGFLNNALKEDWGHDWDLEQQETLSQTVKKKAIEVWEREGFSSQSEYEKFMWKKQMMENGYENLIPADY